MRCIRERSQRQGPILLRAEQMDKQRLHLWSSSTKMHRKLPAWSWRLLAFSHCCQHAQKCLTPNVKNQLADQHLQANTGDITSVTDTRVAREKLGQLQREHKYPADITKQVKQKPVALRYVSYQRDTKQVMFESVDTMDNAKAKAQAGSGGIIKNQHNHSAGAIKDTNKWRS